MSLGGSRLAVATIGMDTTRSPTGASDASNATATATMGTTRMAERELLLL